MKQKDFLNILYTLNIATVLDGLKSHPIANKPEYFGFVREQLWHRMLGDIELPETSRFFQFDGALSIGHIYEFLHKTILDKLQEDTLFILEDINRSKMWKSYRLIDEQLDTIGKESINVKSLRIYINIIAGMLQTKRCNDNFFVNMLPLCGILQALLNIFTQYEFNQNAKQLPF